MQSFYLFLLYANFTRFNDNLHDLIVILHDLHDLKLCILIAHATHIALSISLSIFEDLYKNIIKICPKRPYFFID